MTGEKEAPAEMPGLEEIGEIIRHAMASIHSGPIRNPRITSHEAARAILALFAPILAEKDGYKEIVRQAAEARDAAGYIGAVWDCIDDLSARALAAEAALAAERAMLKRIVDLHADWRLCMPKDWEGDPLSDACEDAAAAIRAQGE